MIATIETMKSERVRNCTSMIALGASLPGLNASAPTVTDDTTTSPANRSSRTNAHQRLKRPESSTGGR